MSNVRTETETVIKKILPYLTRRGYDIENDLDFETAVKSPDRYNHGYVDILVTLGKKKPSFLIEAKRLSKTLTEADKKQAISYAKSKDINVPFVVVTNGKDIRCYNSKNGNLILWDGKRTDRIPSKDQVTKVMRILRTKADETNIQISNDESLPFRPSIPLRQLNTLFAKGHNIIRKIEKNEDNAFADFSKLLFLKLLEEKNDIDSNFTLPYSYRFYELAEYSPDNADQVKNAIKSMIQDIIENTKYGEVLQDPIQLSKPQTYLRLVKDLSSVSFCDCSVDSKGAAFEYYVRATLKGKKLGQYFTPRELVKMMCYLVGENKIINSIVSNTPIKVLDPACGTGGFLVFLMQDTLARLKSKLDNREITEKTYINLVKKIKEDIFYGSDANKGVAASAKMNMIVAGDGHTHILYDDSLSKSSINWNSDNPDCSIIMTNPPFGTSEADSLNDEDKEKYNVNSTKGQYLFLQKMIDCTVAGGEICTVIDEGVLNTKLGVKLREHILKNCIIKAVIKLPEETFKPNKINVRASVIYLIKRDKPDEDIEDIYPITFCYIDSLGYDGAGNKIRGFDTNKFLHEISNDLLIHNKCIRNGYHWEAYDVDSGKISADVEHRLDYKYWNPNLRNKIQFLRDNGCLTIKDINTIPTQRGISPKSDLYVDEQDGHALVIKAGSSISKYGEIVISSDSDWIEKSLYDELLNKNKRCIVRRGDVLLASTGDGTIGKCCVYDKSIPAIADGHVTIIRVDSEKINPYYLVDYMRCGFGAVQTAALFSGSTGLVELTPEQVDTIIIDNTGKSKDILKQKRISRTIRRAEKQYIKKIEQATKNLQTAIDALTTTNDEQ